MTKIMKGGIAYNATSNMVALTQAEYNSLSTAQKNNGNFYFITDADPSYFSAENIDYDNTSSGLTATDIQDAIDEVNDNLQVVAVSISSKSSKISNDITTAFRIGKVLYISSAFSNNTNWVGGNDTIFTINNMQVVKETYFPASTSDNSGYGYMSVRNSGSNIEFRIGFNVANGHYVAFNAVILLA